MNHGGKKRAFPSLRFPFNLLLTIFKASFGAPRPLPPFLMVAIKGGKIENTTLFEIPEGQRLHHP